MKDDVKYFYCLLNLKKTHKENVEKDNYELVREFKKKKIIYTIFLLTEKAENNFENMISSL